MLEATKTNKAIASAFGLGLMPIAPGSFGALLGVAIYAVTAMTLGQPARTCVLVAALIVVSFFHYFLTPWSVKYWKNEDPKNFVLDEVAGYLVVPILFPYGEIWQVCLWGFLLSRIIDIIKIPPARQIDRDWHGPWGILLDDIVSGVYASICMYGLAYISRHLGWESWLVAF